MSPEITSPAAVTTSRCLGCELAIPAHACAAYTVPVTQRATITAAPRRHRDNAADLPGYAQTGDGIPGYPAI